jgi:hypothetical protein
MKKISFVLFCAFILFPSDKLSANCQQIAHHVKLFCQPELKHKETSLINCLRRRDTCSTIGAKDSQEQCSEIHQCMESHQRTFNETFNDNHSCRYYWNASSERCFVRRSLFSIVSQCPGRINMIGSISDGFSGGIDQNFDCESHAHVLNESILRCEDLKTRLQENCSSIAQEILADHPKFESSYLNEFQTERWAIPQDTSLQTQDRGRYFFYPESRALESSQPSPMPSSTGR